MNSNSIPSFQAGNVQNQNWLQNASEAGNVQNQNWLQNASEERKEKLAKLLEVQTKILRITTIVNNTKEPLSQATLNEIRDIVKVLHSQQKVLINELFQ